ncbi:MULTISPECIES: hypothetical protein [unclassified Mucilaginibacter]|uniref:hypothetical protein n=1 Tax=unclassified Mucilaginibacter TaxID=2617802 RepID=UPI0031F69A5A
MKLRLTPLNFATAFLIVLAAITWFFKPVSVTGSEFKQWTGTIALIYLLFGMILWFLDMIFRNFFLNTKTLWMVELSFIILTVVIYLFVRQ